VALTHHEPVAELIHESHVAPPLVRSAPTSRDRTF
jgi:hypothetical protein